jgi:hypothetical protein
MRSFALALGSLAIATLFSAPALADCIPGTGVCASAGVGYGNGGVQVQVGLPGYGQAPQYAPPPPPSDEPPPAYQPRRPAPRYAEPAPRRVRYHRPAQPNWGAEKLGIDVHAMGAAGFATSAGGNVYGLGGAGLGLRYRAFPHLGFEANLDLLGGHDYSDRSRFEAAGTVGGLLFLNPRSRAQLYLSGGFLLDHARAWQSSIAYTGSTGGLYVNPSVGYTHLGGYAGVGLEVFLTRRVSFHVDGRGVLRQNVSNGGPEFTDPLTGRTTNTSAGFVGLGGMAFYF